MAMNFCPNCGAKLRSDAKFCGSCGQKLSAEPQKTLAERYAETKSQVQSESPKVELKKSEQPKSVAEVFAASKKNAPSPQAPWMKNPPSQPVQPTYTPQISTEGIVLKSSAPISDKRIPWATTGYFSCVAAIVIGLMLLRSVDVLGAILLLCGFFGVIFVGSKDSSSIDDQLDELRKTKFKFVYNVTADEVFIRLQPALKAIWGEQVSFDRRDEIISVTHDKTIYDLGLNDDGTFLVHWHKTLKNAFFTFESEIALCRKVRTDTSVIAYELQRQFNVTE